ncbi:MAG: head GIN domain-containing protein [Sphingomonas sp.]
MRMSLAAMIAASAAVSGCQIHDSDGEAAVSRNYQVGNFQQIEVAGPYNVEVRTGGTPSVSGQGAQKLMNRTVVEVRGDKLVIHPQEHRGWFHMGWGSHRSAKFTVTVPQLSGATIAGSGDIHVDQVHGTSFEGTVAGSGGLGINTLDVQSLKLAIAGSGGAKASAGRAQSVKYDIAGSGDIDATNVQAQNADVSIAGSGSIRAHASGTAEVSIMGSGDVTITGGAKCRVTKAGSGNAHCS